MENDCFSSFHPFSKRLIQFSVSGAWPSMHWERKREQTGQVTSLLWGCQFLCLNYWRFKTKSTFEYKVSLFSSKINHFFAAHMYALIFDRSFVLPADAIPQRTKKNVNPKSYMIIFSVCCRHCVKACVCVCIMVQACDDEICISAALSPNKDLDIASPSSCISVLRVSLFLFYLIA